MLQTQGGWWGRKGLWAPSTLDMFCRLYIRVTRLGLCPCGERSVFSLVHNPKMIFFLQNKSLRTSSILTRKNYTIEKLHHTDESKRKTTAQRNSFHENKLLGTGLQPWTPMREKITLCLVNKDDIYCETLFTPYRTWKSPWFSWRMKKIDKHQRCIVCGESKGNNLIHLSSSCYYYVVFPWLEKINIPP